MQKLVVIIGICLLLGSCDNTLEINAPWRDIPVVYGILTERDTAHYLRIEKAFLGEDQSAFEIARNPDSLYYDNLVVEIIHVNSGDVFQLTEVDGSLEGLQRQMGVFAESPNLLYKIDADVIDLRPGDRYRLAINRSENLPLVTGETTIVGRPDIRVPLPGNPVRFPVNNQFRVNWIEADFAAFYDITVRLHYRETDPDAPGTFVDKSIDWKFARTVRASEIQVQGRAFYEYIAATLDPEPGIERQAVSIDVIVEAAGSELDEFIRITQANTGITSVGGDIPRFSNISEGVGLFTSVNFDIQSGYNLHPQTLDSLRDGSITGDLGF